MFKSEKLYQFLKGMQFRLLCILSLAIFCSSIIVFFVVYSSFYNITLHDIRERTKIVNNYARKIIPADIFDELTVKEDNTKEVYAEVQNELNKVRQIANILYLFTASLDKEGDPVYIVDGLDPDASDFRAIGDKIEPEISSMLRQCLAGNIIEADDIVSADWGTVFITCWPIKEAEIVKGAVVMEFDATSLYMENTHNKLYTLGISLIIALAFLGFVTYTLQRFFLKPLMEIKSAANALPYDGYTARVVENATTAEMLELQQAFNTMADRLCTNIQEIKDAEKARVLAEEASQAKSNFLANMSHEIRTPMNAILGLAYIALQNNLSKQQHDYFTQIHTAATGLLSIINDILDFSKIEARKMELEKLPFSLQENLCSVYDMITFKAADKKITICTNFAPNICDTLMGDAPRLRQILINLLGNAVKFTHKGGILLEVEAEKLMPHKVVLRFSVHDTGIGIAPDMLDNLFQPFSQADGSITRRFGGTGLGLAISKELVELMGGTMQVKSSLDFGSTFSFSLPFDLAVESQSNPKKENLTSEEVNLILGKHILVVEDNEINQMIAQSILEHGGLQVSIASNGVEAIEAVKTGNFDLVLMDIQMPVMDGLEATRQIRTLPDISKNLPILAMTAHAMSDDYAKSIAAGMNSHITKPIDPERLFAELVYWLQSNQ